MPVPLGATTMAGLCLHDGKAAKGDYPCSGECKEVSFHSSLLRHLERMGQGRRKADWETYQTDQVLRFPPGISRYIIGAKGSLLCICRHKECGGDPSRSSPFPPL